MRKLVHPNLVNLKDIFLERNKLMLVMELMQVKKYKTQVTQQGNIHMIDFETNFFRAEL